MGTNFPCTVVDYYLIATNFHYFLPSQRDGLQPILNLPGAFNSTWTQAAGTVPKYKGSWFHHVGKVASGTLFFPFGNALLWCYSCITDTIHLWQSCILLQVKYYFNLRNPINYIFLKLLWQLGIREWHFHHLQRKHLCSWTNPTLPKELQHLSKNVTKKSARHI